MTEAVTARQESSPVTSTKKEVTFVYQKLLLFLSKPQAWHITAAVYKFYNN